MAKQLTALITGASSGIGLELATVCTAHGHNVVLVARDRSRLAAIAIDLEATYNITATALVADLAKPGAAVGLIKQLDRTKLTIDVLINNAGVGIGGRFVKNDPQQLAQMLQLNIITLTELTRLLAPGMVARGHGRILNLASVAAFLPIPSMAAYAATKAYVLSLSEALNVELNTAGVTVTALCPGPTQTNFAEAAHLKNPGRFGYGQLSATEVARSGYAAMMAGKPVMVPGVKNKLAAAGAHLASGSALARLAKRGGH